MKLNKLALAVATIAIAPLASAGVTITPLVGYHYSDAEDTNDKQRDVLKTGKDLYVNKDGKSIDGRAGKVPNGGVSMESGLYTGVAVGVELTPSIQAQIEYGVSDANGEASENSAKAGVNRFDIKEENVSANLLIGASQFIDMPNKFDPYFLVGAGQSKISVENQKTYTAGKTSQTGKTGLIKAGTEVAESKDTIGNLGLGAMYHINDNLSLRGEGRAVHNFDNNWWEGLALAGLEVKLGGKKAPVAPPPAEPDVVEVVEEVVEEVVQEVDSDRDGVIDALDACPNTPMNLVVDARGCPRKVPMTDELKMELRVFFDNDSSAIKQQYKPEIAKVASKMREYPNSTARIEGHASKTGPSARYNMRLSEARAAAVKSMLTNEFGVAPNRLATQGFGYDRPIADNKTAEGRAMNRRVYAIITGDKTVNVDETK